jgi:hypothetical protein
LIIDHAGHPRTRSPRSLGARHVRK